MRRLVRWFLLFVSRHPFAILSSWIILTASTYPLCTYPGDMSSRVDTALFQVNGAAEYLLYPILYRRAPELALLKATLQEQEGADITLLEPPSDNFSVNGKLLKAAYVLSKSENSAAARYALATRSVAVGEGPLLFLAVALNGLELESLARLLVLVLGMVGAGLTINSYFKKFSLLGSKWVLGIASLTMVFMELILGLALLKCLGIYVNPNILVELGLWYMMAVGFQTTSTLARAVKQSRKGLDGNIETVVGVEQSSGILLGKVSERAVVFSLLSLSAKAGLKEFFMLGAMMAFLEAILLFTFLLAVISIDLRLTKPESQGGSVQSQERSKASTARFDGTMACERGSLLAAILVFVLHSLEVLSTFGSELSPKVNTPILRKLVIESIGNRSSVNLYPSRLLLSPSTLPGMIGSSFKMIEAQMVNFDFSIHLKLVLFSILPVSVIFNCILLSRHGRDARNSRPVKSKPLSFDVEKPLESEEGLLDALRGGRVPLHALEKHTSDFDSAVRIRRVYLQTVMEAPDALTSIPWNGYDYEQIYGRNCENVVGYVPLPLGVAGPIKVDGIEHYIPLSTTEGALVASTSRGCKAVSYAGGVQTAILDDGMTRAPVVCFPSLQESVEFVKWIEGNFEHIAQIFQGTSQYLHFIDVKSRVVGKLVYLRFKAKTGDAMGMNMVSRATQKALRSLQLEFPEMTVVSLSGNYCSDKKNAAINWIEGRGKSVVAESVIPENIIKTILKTTAKALVEANTAKNLVGSMVAGASGDGCNAHAANIIAAMFIALGQDPAQVVSSSSCLTFMETVNGGRDVYISCTMPSLEVGTVGGGTGLPAQRACLSLLQLSARGGDRESSSHPVNNGSAGRLARVMAATVLAGELSLLAALTEGSLVKAHQELNGASKSPPPSAPSSTE